jgi:beta-N-acetylglucosaminidase
MSRKHIKPICIIITSLIITTLGASYVTKILLDSEYSKMNAKQHVEFKKEMDNFRKELDTKMGIINSNNEEMNKMQKEIKGLKSTVEQKDKLIKSLSCNFGAKFNPNNLKEVSGANKVTMKKILKGKPMEGYAGVFVEAERKFRINAIGLASIIAQESGWGKSPAARNLNNMSGTYINGKLAYFSSKEESIMYTAENIANNYLNPKGKYYSGTSVQAINTRYCLEDDGKTPMYSWTTNVTSISRGMVSKGN